MRYFAMIHGERRGPFELSQLREAGVGPDTYVWCKDMKDWEPAADVPDICRFWRQEIARIMHPETVPPVAPDERVKEIPADGQTAEPRYRRTILGEEYDAAMQPDDETLATPPPSLLPFAILVTLLFFPVTGAVAIYHSLQARKLWGHSVNLKGEDRLSLQREAYDSVRASKMWIGISFFLGLILWAFIFRFFI
jgi:hypothetical protein